MEHGHGLEERRLGSGRWRSFWARQTEFEAAEMVTDRTGPEREDDTESCAELAVIWLGGLELETAAEMVRILIVDFGKRDVVVMDGEIGKKEVGGSGVWV
ncbi:hypothetical protein M0R45_016410 [Rubus argutus]|uniref:Uncharacterized protein n=1 Tax=Rubus argutus TaxID=59490 RepID=A0AAW1XRV5_RUBAR